MEILIAEDEELLAQSLKKNFLDEGYNAMIASDGEETLKIMSEIDFDCLLLDWRMPKMSGLEVCKKLRKEGNDTPIILLTALSDISNKVEALNHGADDYITKPFSFSEVIARIQAVLRRYKTIKNVLNFDRFSLDLVNHKLHTPTEEIKLTEKEFELLKFFLTNKGSIVGKDELCKGVWELEFTPSTNIVEAAVKNLRKKLEEATGGKKFIKTIYGEGYLFIAE